MTGASIKNESTASVMADRVRQALFGLFLLSLGVYAYGAFTSTLLDPGLADERAYLMTASRMPEEDIAEVRRRAEAYWNRYKNVGADAHYGRNGALGIYGARAHYQKHGRYEGRIWPE